MPRGDKSSYTGKQKRQVEHIEEGYEHRGIPEKEAERRAWATVNKETHGGKKSGSGRGTEEDHSPSKKGGRLGGAASAKRSAAERSQPAKKSAEKKAAWRLKVNPQIVVALAEQELRQWSRGSKARSSSSPGPLPASEKRQHVVSLQRARR
jgi:hypothetical protein